MRVSPILPSYTNNVKYSEMSQGFLLTSLMWTTYASDTYLAMKQRSSLVFRVWVLWHLVNNKTKWKKRSPGVDWWKLLFQLFYPNLNKIIPCLNFFWNDNTYHTVCTYSRGIVVTFELLHVVLFPEHVYELPSESLWLSIKRSVRCEEYSRWPLFFQGQQITFS